MKACNASFIKSYLHWRVKHSRIRKVSSILTYWNVLSMVYATKTQRYMDGGMLYDIGNVRWPFIPCVFELALIGPESGFMRNWHLHSI
jgi:hypothetical protein